jgi:hypothetical protein
MTFSAFFMTKTIYILNIAIRASIIIGGLLIECNVMNISQTQYQSVQWIGRCMIAFGILRLGWFFYQIKQQRDSKEEIIDEERR